MINKKIGIIGYGSMGSMLINQFYKSKKIEKHGLFVATRSLAKFDKKAYPDVTLCATNTELATKCDVIFLCVKPLEILAVLAEIKSSLNSDKHLISIAGSVTLELLEKHFAGKISHVLPTLISELREGVTLVCHNHTVKANDSKYVEELLSTLGKVKSVAENEFEVLSILTSCAPGLIAAILQTYTRTATAYTTLSEQEIKELIMTTVYGTAKYIQETGSGFDETINRVATKGGSTEVGVEVLGSQLPGIFKKMFEKIRARQTNRKDTIYAQFNKE